MRPSLATPPLFAALEPAHRVLLSGAGGGFDVYAGLPLAPALWDRGVEVHLANLSFAPLTLVAPEQWLESNVAAVTPDVARHVAYFPELALAHWLAERGLPATVYALRRTRVQPLRAAYRNLVSSLGVDAIVLIDGGTDILLRGDESGLGTPVEDIGSLAAVAGLDVPIKLVTCLGFGIDAYHGVNHVQVLENLAALDRDGSCLSAMALRAVRAIRGRTGGSDGHGPPSYSGLDPPLRLLLRRRQRFSRPWQVNGGGIPCLRRLERV